MEEKSDTTVTDEVESRLKDLFGQSEKAFSSKEAGSVPEGSFLRNLKAIVLSIDWEISDEIMTSFIKEIGRLEDTYKDDKMIRLFYYSFGSLRP